jgi:hypothetical protein
VQCHGDPVIYLCLLSSAVREFTEFYMRLGTNPIWSDDLKKAISDNDISIKGQNENLVIFYTKVHSTAMNRDGLLEDDKRKKNKKGKFTVLNKVRYLNHWTFKFSEWKDMSINCARNREEMVRTKKSRKEIFFWKNNRGPNPSGLDKYVETIGMILPSPRQQPEQLVEDCETGKLKKRWYTTRIDQIVGVAYRDTALLKEAVVARSEKKKNASKKEIRLAPVNDGERLGNESVPADDGVETAAALATNTATEQKAIATATAPPAAAAPPPPWPPPPPPPCPPSMSNPSTSIRGLLVQMSQRK